MKRTLSIPTKIIFLLCAGLILSSCKKKDDTTNSSAAVPDIYKKIYGATDLYVDGDYVVITANGLPDHKSPYYQNTQWSYLYQAYNGSGTFNQNPNKIGQQSYTYRIPLNPTKAASSQATPLGAMGVSLNGVPFYNQYAGPNNQALTNEILSFDQYNGHPDQSSTYHYHLEPVYLTALYGKSSLLGFLLDGFPVYGPNENGTAVQDADLDAYHGHFHSTYDFPNGIYHYHTTANAPYINGSGYYGTPGTVTH